MKEVRIMDLVVGKRQQPTRNQSLKTNNQSRAGLFTKKDAKDSTVDGKGNYELRVLGC